MAISFDPTRIILARESRGVTQAKLADMLSVSSQQLSQWERGETRPNTDNLTKIVNALGAPIKFFFVQDGASGAVDVQ